MGEPLFYLQIVDRNGIVAHLPGGGTLEADLIGVLTQAIAAKQDQVTQAIVAKGVGVFRTVAHVDQDIQDGLREELPKIIQDGIAEAFMSLKAQTRLIA